MKRDELTQKLAEDLGLSADSHGEPYPGDSAQPGGTARKVSEHLVKQLKKSGLCDGPNPQSDK